MDTRLAEALARCGTDIEGAVRRVNNSEALYKSCLKMFIDDTTVRELNEAVGEGSWDAAFTAAHALKGLAGNMGFVPLMHSAGQMVIAVRAGKTDELSEHAAQINRDYNKISAQ